MTTLKGANNIAQEAHDNAVGKGFYKDWTDLTNAVWTNDDLPMAERERLGNIVTRLTRNEKLLLIVSEVIEYMESIRKNKGDDQEEMADVFIRALDLSAFDDVDLDKVVPEKMLKNRGRDERHGVGF